MDSCSKNHKLTLSPPIPLWLYALHRSNPPFLIFDIRSARMSQIKNSGLDQYATEPIEQQEFATAGGEGLIHHF